ncbi:MAG: hypothetical protein JWP08_1801 [Bryobacterales bacterium]|nr:hypothetical protein [Bryobacterales bacterium]
MESLSPFLQGFFLPYNMPVVPKTLLLQSFGCVRRGHDLDLDAKTSKATQMMMCPILSSSLLGSTFNTAKGYFSAEHAVQDD